MDTYQKAVKFTLSQVVHDLVKKKSFATLLWPDDDRRLILPIPFGTELGAAHAAAEAALRKHEHDIHTTSVGAE
jgi:hypothetical protein